MKAHNILIAACFAISITTAGCVVPVPVGHDHRAERHEEREEERNAEERREHERREEAREEHLRHDDDRR